MANSGISVDKKSVSETLQLFKDKKLRCFSMVFDSKSDPKKVILGTEEPLPYVPKGTPISQCESVLKNFNFEECEFGFFLMYCRCAVVANTGNEPEFRDDPVLVKFIDESKCTVKLKMCGASTWANVKKYVSIIGKFAAVEVSSVGELNEEVFEQYISTFHPVGTVVGFEGFKVQKGKLCED